MSLRRQKLSYPQEAVSQRRTVKVKQTLTFGTVTRPLPEELKEILHGLQGLFKKGPKL